MRKRTKHTAKSTPNDTLISNGTHVEGQLNVPSNLRIDGSFHGDISCKGTIVIGEQGDVHAKVSANDIIISGVMNGEIRCEGKLTITSTGTLNGNCESQWIIIQEGGILNGTSLTERKDQALKRGNAAAFTAEVESATSRSEKQAG
ncbi:bactofilin family protein [Paenibacillus sp. 1001270B_150601_E10]|uniref:bactofilin family protein n=1 Tax=Paenibacillus sp. 1001270B_150601_E10 TaxID=2787079 RepID=UPI00189C7737|nr:polymer-forming cytoskeletal protein [Paenibacillus sp. 1001270B_150601_E10]